MAEIPPSGGPSQSPSEPRYVPYYRGGPPTGLDSARLKALADGYFALNWVFLINILLAFGLNIAAAAIGAGSPGGFIPSPLSGLVPLAMLGFVFFAIALLTFPHNKKIAFGKGWGDSGAFLASFLMGLNSAVCCGIIGYVVMQQIASNEMKKYGLRVGAFGIKKRDVEAVLRQMQPAAQPPQAPPGFEA